MPLFLVTGLPGSGKSTIYAELKSRGYEAYDADEDGLAAWYNGVTGLWTDVSIEDCTPEFLLKHSRDIPRKTVENLALIARDKPVFLCGDPENEAELQDLFHEVFALILDEEVRDYRLKTRTNNKWGKLPHEREYSKTFSKKWRRYCKEFEYTLIDASQPVKDSVDQILERANAT